eukprot:7379601-Pyramimonas_sp.AAC.1
MRVVLYYDPAYVPVTRVWVTDPDPKCGAQWLKKLPESTNPGIHPGRCFNVNQAQRRQAVDQYKAEERGFFGIDDPGPCLPPLRHIGLDVEDPPTPPDPAVAQPPAARPFSEEGAAYLATHPMARRAAPC